MFIPRLEDSSRLRELYEKIRHDDSIESMLAHADAMLEEQDPVGELIVLGDSIMTARAEGKYDATQIQRAMEIYGGVEADFRMKFPFFKASDWDHGFPLAIKAMPHYTVGDFNYITPHKKEALEELANSRYGMRVRSMDLQAMHLVDVEPVARFRQLEKLGLAYCMSIQYTFLSDLKNLRSLDLRHSSFFYLGQLDGLRNIEELDISNTIVSDLSPLAGMRKLKVLSANNTQVTDLSPLENLPELEEVHVRNTGVTDASMLKQVSVITGLPLDTEGITEYP